MNDGESHVPANVARRSCLAIVCASPLKEKRTRENTSEHIMLLYLTQILINEDGEIVIFLMIVENYIHFCVCLFTQPRDGNYGDVIWIWNTV